MGTVRLSRAQRKALSIIQDYARSTGRRCFTYNELFHWWMKANIPINSNTLERRIRELASMGLLSRRDEERRGRRVRVFCLEEG